jgi:hypothetical protein
VLLGVFRQVGEHVKVGGGITLGGVDDDYLTLDEERNLGTFLNVVADF